VGVSVSSINRLEREGKFPARRKIAEKAMGWLASDIEEWMQNLPKVTYNKQGLQDDR
ncbi:MAG: AlpA family phage regulatory protein, partial [Alteromonas sp.]|nr:AlpA family phage regulatory protein [Alteromonas sp.]